MGIFNKKSPEVVVQEDTTFLRYVMRKTCGCRTDAEVDAKIQSLRVSMAAFEQKRLHDEERERQTALGEARSLQEAHDLCLKHLPHIQAYFCPTATVKSTRPQFMDIGDDLTVTCPECGKKVDVSKQVHQAALRYEAMGPRIEQALADSAMPMGGSIKDGSIFKVGHAVVYNGQYCSTVIEIVIKGCRVLGERPAPRQK